MPAAATKTAARKTVRRSTKKAVKKVVKKAPAKARGMSPAHKAALAQGRRESRAINKYLDALKAGKGKRTPSSIEARLSRIARTFEEASAMQQLELTQERMNLENEKTRLETRADLSALEKDFVAVAKGYAARRNISYSAFRSMGVSAEVLTKAGVKRTRG
jgi:hypothetical protein